jgi:hypothetical protein
MEQNCCSFTSNNWFDSVHTSLSNSTQPGTYVACGADFAGTVTSFLVASLSFSIDLIRTNISDRTCLTDIQSSSSNLINYFESWEMNHLLEQTDIPDISKYIPFTNEHMPHLVTQFTHSMTAGIVLQTEISVEVVNFIHFFLL